MVRALQILSIAGETPLTECRRSMWTLVNVGQNVIVVLFHNDCVVLIKHGQFGRTTQWHVHFPSDGVPVLEVIKRTPS